MSKAGARKGKCLERKGNQREREKNGVSAAANSRQNGRRMLRVGRALPSSLVPADAALLDLVEQCLVAHAELLGGSPPVPMHVAERLFDDRALRFQRGV